MAPQIPSCEPVSFVAGDTVAWTKALSDYPPSDGWTLKYRLVGDPQINGGTAYTASVSNGQYALTIPAADTAGILSDSTYRLLGWVEGVNSERHSVHESIVTALANIAAAGIEDLQTDAERELALVDAAIQSRAGAEGIIAYSVDGRSVTFDTLADARVHRGILRAQIWREQNKGRSFPVHQAVTRGPR